MAFAGPVSNGKFSFAVDSFYVETSNHNLHRRATVPELQSLFDTSTASKTPDPVGHWYEAQLLHYGLAPSKNKAVAKMRLLDAVRGGGLAVPRDIVKIEGDLKREWKRRDKEARSGGSSGTGAAGGAGGAGASAKAGGNKRKRDGEESAPTSKATAAKKTKAADLTPAKKTETGAGVKKPAAKSSAKKSEPEPLPMVDPARPRTKLTAKCSRGRGGATVGSRGGSTAGSRSSQIPAASIDPEPAQPPRTKQTAKCSRGRGGATASSREGISQTPAASIDNPEPARGPRTKQTARRSNPFFGDRRPTDPLYKQEYSTPVNHSSFEYVGLLCNFLSCACL